MTFRQYVDQPDGLSSATRGHDVEIEDGVKYLINPGAIGQPRDGDPRAGYAIVDVEERSVELVRLAYPVDETRAKVVEAGLPEILGARLAVGR
jgi:diadenosine tetraphosphatase ApaH/serine/threonine PP2A family protein phosphatase